MVATLSGVRAVQQEFETQFVTADSLLYAVEHRPWLPPDTPWLFSQTWNDALFAHFAMEPRALRRLVPEALTLDLYDGVAWLTIACFAISHLRPSGVPPLPVLSYFPQVNVRTCVSRDGKPGVYCFSLDAANLSAVWAGRVFFRMQYWHASIQLSREALGEEQTIRFRSRRLHGPAAHNGPAALEAVYSPEGEAKAAPVKSLDEFLMERYCAYSSSRGRLYRSEVHHQPWPLQRTGAEFVGNSLAEPLGLELPPAPQLCHFSRCNKLLVWAPERIRPSG